MKKFIHFLFSIIIGSFNLCAQTYEWTETAGGIYGDAVKSIATDQAGNVYYTGYFTSNFDFNGSAAVDLQINAGDFDFFVVKKDASGNYLWCKTFGNANSNRAYSINVDVLGNIIIGGSFQNSMDFDLSAGSAIRTPVGLYDGFVLKLDNNGNFIWVKTFGGAGSSVWPLSIQSDGNGNIFSAGFYQNAAIDIDPSANTATLPFYGGVQDIYVQKLDVNGNYIWSASAGGTGVDRANSLALDNNGNSYVAGCFQNTVDFNTGVGVNNQTASSDDGFLLKLDANGNYVNCVTSAGAGTEQFTSLAYSSSDNNLVLAGYFTGTLDFNYGAGTDSKTVTGSSDGFIQKLDLALNHSWVKNIGGPNAIITYAVDVDNAGNIYSSGRFNTTVDLNPGAGTDTRTSNGIFDVYLQKLNTSGLYSWGLTFGGTGIDEPTYLSIHNSGAIYLGGVYNNTVDFNPFAAVNSKTSVANDDGFISKFTFCMSSSNSITLNACGSQTVNNQTYTSSGVYTQLLTNVNGCDSTLTINLTISNTNAPAGTATQTFCNSATISNLSATGTFIQWYAASSGGAPLTGSTALVNGTTYYASQTLSGCESATRLAVNVVINNTGAPTGTATQTFCNSATISNLSATGTSIQWYAASSGGAPLTGSTALVNGATYYASQTISGCESTTRLAVNVVINNTGAPTGTVTQTFCNSASISNLSATGTSIQWYAASSGGAPLTGSTALVNGATYYASQTMSGCESTTRLEVNVVINNTGAPTGTVTQTFCNSASISNLSATGTSIQWYAASSGGSPLTGSTALVNGATYYASQIISGCESTTRLAVNVVINNTGAPIGTVTQTFCNSATLSNLSVTGTSIQWYAASSGGSPLTGSTALVNGATYYASQTISGCESTTRLAVNVVINNTGAPTGTVTQTFCNSASISNLSATGTFIQWYAASSGGSPLTGSITLVNGATYYASQTITGCESTTRLAVNVVINSVTDISTSVSGITINANNSGSSYVWMDCNNNYSIITGETNQSYTPTSNGSFAVQLTQNGCIDTSSCVIITDVGIDAIDKNQALMIFPNPTSGVFTVDLVQTEDDILISISDINGRIISYENFKDKQLIDLFINDSAGIYLITISTSEWKKVIKLIKE